MSVTIGRLLLIWLVGFLALTLVVVSALVLRHEQRFLEEELRATSAAMARALAVATAAGEPRPDLPLAGMSDLKVAEVRDHRGRLLWRYGPTPAEARAVDGSLVEVRQALPGPAGGELTLLVSPTRIRRHLLVSAERLVAALVAAILLSLLVGVVLVNRVTRPLRALATHLRAVHPAAAAPFDPPPATVAEVVELSRSFNDLTRRLAAHEADKMQTVATLAGGVAHDFNNLLAGIHVHLSWVERDPAAAPEALAAVRALADEGAEVVQELLLFARRETTPHRPVDLARLVADQGRVLRHLVPDSTRLEVAVAPSPLPVRGNPAALRRLLLNLVLNARDAVEPGAGRIRLEAGRDGDGGVFLAVEDNGGGIPEEVRERMFEPFVSSRRDGRGAGLGLAVVYAVVREHDGGIAVDSGPGGGTRVRVVLPLAGAGELDEGPAEAAAMRVLLVEPDSRRAARLLEELASVGVEARHALAPAEAVEIAAGWTPDAVVVGGGGTSDGALDWLAAVGRPAVLVAAGAGATVGTGVATVRLEGPVDGESLRAALAEALDSTRPTG